MREKTKQELCQTLFEQMEIHKHGCVEVGPAYRRLARYNAIKEYGRKPRRYLPVLNSAEWVEKILWDEGRHPHRSRILEQETAT